MTRLTTRLATFSDAGGATAGLNIITIRPSSQSGVGVDFAHDVGTWAEAEAATALFRRAVWEALADGGGAYPEAEAREMLRRLGWQSGYPLMLQADPGEQVEYRFTFGPLSCAFLPELVPDDTPDGGCCLDDRGPSSREVGGGRTAPRVDAPSLAVLFQAGDPIPFGEGADAIARRLAARFQFRYRVDTFSGGELAAATPTERFRQLTRIFREYRAVMFLGHRRLPERDNPGGWQLAPDLALSMRDIRGYLADPPARARPGSQRAAACVPELIFADCCRSAGREPGTDRRAEVVYPWEFIQAGVRFFVGTSMDVVFDRQAPERSFELVVRLAGEFFERWLESPGGAVYHLHEAKRACGFHLLTRLYQIYVGQEPREYYEPPEPPSSGRAEPAEPEAPPDESPRPAPQPRPSAGAVVGGIGPGDRLGEYEVEAELWSDPHSRTFAARRAGEPRAHHLVTVLADQYQDAPGLAGRLRAAVELLAEFRAAPRLLVPDRYAEVELSRGDRPILPVHVLVSEQAWADGWEPLAARMTPGRAADDFGWALQVGADVADGLVPLHARGLAHGNLDPGAVVLARTGDAVRAVVKDAWVFPALGGRLTPPRYAPPAAATDSPEPAGAAKEDIWALGVLLYELAAGRTPFDDDHPPEQGPRPLAEALGSAAVDLPPALDGVVRDCLVPEPQFLPDADVVYRRLLLGRQIGGADIGDLESTLSARIQAGHRLFVLYAGDGDEAVEALAAMTRHRHPRSPVMPLPGPRHGAVPRVTFRLYVMAEGSGLVEQPTGRTEVPWFDAADSGLTGVHPDAVAAANAENILGHVAENVRPEVVRGDDGEELQFPVVLIRGNYWWASGPGAWRRLRQFQTEPARSPAVVLSDNAIFVPGDLGPLFTGMALPPPRPAVLFETILRYVQAHNRMPARAASALAMALTRDLFPCPRREAEQILRQCALRDGAVTERAVALRDELREREFRALGTAAYTPSEKLPTLDALGLPDPAFGDAHRWVGHLLAGADRSEESGVPRLVLVTGGEGCGKTCLARALAGSAGRPLVRLDANSWLRGGLGESEAALGQILGAVSDLHHAVVLFDELDRFFPPPPGVAPPDYQPTLTRMAAILVRWLDRQPDGIVSVLVARSPSGLPPEWQRRVALRLDLPEPQDVHYRARVFAAVFRRCGLAALAGDVDLVNRLAEQTLPGRLARRLPSPLARRWPDLFPGHPAELRTGAQIEAWVHETITLLDSPATPAHTREFWLQAV